MKTDFLCEECHQQNLLIPTWKDQNGKPTDEFDEHEAGGDSYCIDRKKLVFVETKQGLMREMVQKAIKLNLKEDV